MNSGGKLKIAADGEGVQQVLMRCRSTKSPRFSAQWKKPSPRVERDEPPPSHNHFSSHFQAFLPLHMWSLGWTSEAMRSWAPAAL